MRGLAQGRRNPQQRGDERRNPQRKDPTTADRSTLGPSGGADKSLSGSLQELLETRLVDHLDPQLLGLRELGPARVLADDDVVGLLADASERPSRRGSSIAWVACSREYFSRVPVITKVLPSSGPSFLRGASFGSTPARRSFSMISEVAFLREELDDRACDDVADAFDRLSSSAVIVDQAIERSDLGGEVERVAPDVRDAEADQQVRRASASSSPRSTVMRLSTDISPHPSSSQDRSRVRK